MFPKWFISSCTLLPTTCEINAISQTSVFSGIVYNLETHDQAFRAVLY